MRKIIRSISFAFAGFLMLGVVTASGQIGISFHDGAGPGANPPIAPIGPGETAGFAGYAQANWNVVGGASGSELALVDASGAPTLTTMTFSADAVWGRGDVPDTPDGRLMTAWLDGRGTDPTTVQFNNISYATYSIVLYSHGPGDLLRGREVTLVDPTDDSVIEGSYFFRDPEDQGSNFFDGTFVQAALSTEEDVNEMPVGNVWIIEGLTNPNVRLVLDDFGQEGLVNQRYNINAIQVIPEPSTYALIAGFLGLMATVIIRRARRKTVS